eukprot:CAMPEP_0197176732 /NCGR_PEP_ID=MMETSP1423-20130617/2555_1 /TAXON_ID=476441 /ORGANISM="Pseudo-nitzschia heimii, Strain UNC1101" /LENGTH=258 /DNA_ID=CAMNT_0042626141 /DNA_START=30 /DNA_END=806 /DNA_ORIENTATION=-
MTGNNSVHDQMNRSRKKSTMFDDDLEILVKNVLQLPLDNAIPLAIYHHAGVSTWHQFMYMDESDVFEATYLDKSGKMKYLTRYETKILRWLIGYVRENIDSQQFGSEQPSFYNKDGFTKYTQHRRKMAEFMANYRTTKSSRNRKIEAENVPSNIVIETSHDPTEEEKSPVSSQTLVQKQETSLKDESSSVAEKKDHITHERGSQHRRRKSSFRSKSMKSQDPTIQSIVDLADELKASQHHRPKSDKTLRSRTQATRTQ